MQERKTTGRKLSLGHVESTSQGTGSPPFRSRGAVFENRTSNSWQPSQTRSGFSLLLGFLMYPAFSSWWLLSWQQWQLSLSLVDSENTRDILHPTPTPLSVISTSLSLCLYLCACVHICVNIQKGMHMESKGQPWVVVQLPILLFDTWSLTGPGLLIWLCWLTSEPQWIICLSPPFQHWDYKDVPQCLTSLYVFWGASTLLIGTLLPM